MLTDFESPKGLGGSSWFFLGAQVGPEESPGGLAGSQGGSLGGFEKITFYLLEVSLSTI